MKIVCWSPATRRIFLQIKPAYVFRTGVSGGLSCDVLHPVIFSMQTTLTIRCEASQLHPATRRLAGRVNPEALPQYRPLGGNLRVFFSSDTRSGSAATE